MTYLLTSPQRKASGGTLYFEFQKGPFKGKFWKDDSLYLHADTFDRLDFSPLFSAALPDFHYYGDTRVSPHQYELLNASALERGGETALLFAELHTWVTECFQKDPCFTILGI